jgi:hypothetical protein
MFNFIIPPLVPAITISSLIVPPTPKIKRLPRIYIFTLGGTIKLLIRDVFNEIRNLTVEIFT